MSDNSDGTAFPPHLAYRQDNNTPTPHFSPPHTILDIKPATPPQHNQHHMSINEQPILNTSSRVRRPRALTLANPSSPSVHFNATHSACSLISPAFPHSPHILSALPTVPQCPHNVSNLGLMMGYGTADHHHHLSPKSAQHRNRTVSLTVRTDVPPHGLAGPLTATAATNRSQLVNDSFINNLPMSARFPIKSAFGTGSNHLWTPPQDDEIDSSNDGNQLDLFGLISPRAAKMPSMFMSSQNTAEEFRSRSRAFSTTSRTPSTSLGDASGKGSLYTNSSSSISQSEMDYFTNSGNDLAAYRRARRMTEGAATTMIPSLPNTSYTLDEDDDSPRAGEEDDVLRTFTYLGLDDSDSSIQPTSSPPVSRATGGPHVEIIPPIQNSQTRLELPSSGSLSTRLNSRRAPPPQSLSLAPVSNQPTSLTIHSATFPKPLPPTTPTFVAGPATAGFGPQRTPARSPTTLCASSPTLGRSRTMSQLSARPLGFAKEWSGSALISPRPSTGLLDPMSSWPTSYSSNPFRSTPHYQGPGTPDSGRLHVYVPGSEFSSDHQFSAHSSASTPYGYFGSQGTSVNGNGHSQLTDHSQISPYPYPRPSVVVQPNPNPVHPTIHGHPQHPTRALWIGNLDTKSVKSDDLMAVFFPYGAIESCRLLPDKECAFVNYYQLSDAINARQAMQGCLLGNSHIKIGFGKVAKAEQFGAVFAASQITAPSVFPYVQPVTVSSNLAPTTANQPMTNYHGVNGVSDYITDSILSTGNTGSNMHKDREMNLTDNNTPSRALWIGNLPPSFTVQQLSTMFSPFGHIESCRILTHKNCGFVNYLHEAEAVHARRAMHGQDIHGFHIRIGFARVPTSPPKQPSGVDVNTTLLSNINGTFVPGIMPYVNGHAAPEDDQQLQHVSAARSNQDQAGAYAPNGGIYPAMNGMSGPIDTTDLSFGPVLGPDDATSPLLNLSVVKEEEEEDLLGDVTTHPYASEENPASTRLDPLFVREIQCMLEVAESETDVCLIFDGCISNLDELVYDYAGNAILQNLIERLPVEKLEQLATQLVPNLVKVFVHRHGTWVMQKLMERLHSVLSSETNPKEQGIEVEINKVGPKSYSKEDHLCANQIVQLILNSVSTNLPVLLCDPIANYVVQNALKIPGAAPILFSSPQSTRYIAAIAQNKAGARALRGCLESSFITSEQKKLVANQLLRNAPTLVHDPNASKFLYAWLLDASKLPGRYRCMADVLVPQLVRVSTSRVTAPLVLRLAAQSSDEYARNAIIKEMFLGFGTGGVTSSPENASVVDSHSNSTNKIHTQNYDLSVLDRILADQAVGIALVHRVLAFVPNHGDRVQYIERVQNAMSGRLVMNGGGRANGTTTTTTLSTTTNVLLGSHQHQIHIHPSTPPNGQYAVPPQQHNPPMYMNHHHPHPYPLPAMYMIPPGGYNMVNSTTPLPPQSHFNYGVVPPGPGLSSYVPRYGYGPDVSFTPQN